MGSTKLNSLTPSKLKASLVKGGANLPSLSDPHHKSAAVSARMIEWHNGVPTLVTKNVIPASAVPDLVMSALSAPYKDDLGLFPEYEGMSNLEVALLQAAGSAAMGSLDHLNALLNRGIGTPKSTSEVKNLNMTYQDLLDAMAREEAKHKDMEQKTAGSKIIDAEARTMPDEDPE